MPRLLLSFTVALPLAGCFFSYPAEVPQTRTILPSFDRSWDAALGAATDVDVTITSADRAAGRILGNKAGAEVTIDVLRQADGTVKVSFKTSGSESKALGDRLESAYRRRMGT